MINPGQILQQHYRAIQLIGDCGFGQTWEVDDRGTIKIMKILQVPREIEDEEIEQVISLFEQEAKVLTYLHEPGLPKVEPEGYFIWSEAGDEPLHCLVMEKIEGINLSDWLQQIHHNQPIEEEQAIAWLTQLVEIIGKLHQNHCIHRDLKPTNIMLRSSPAQNSNHNGAKQPSGSYENLPKQEASQQTDGKASRANNLSSISLTEENVAQLGNDPEQTRETLDHKQEVENEKNHTDHQQDSQKQKWGQLALIDFGATRQVTETYLRQFEGKDVTGMISQGYTSPEQYEGKITRQSDVFAIARTIVYLVTAQDPTNLPTDPQSGRLMWRHHATQISKTLADLIDEMMANLPQCRPQTTEDILERLANYNQQVQAEIDPTQSKQPAPAKKNYLSDFPLQQKIQNFKSKYQETTPKVNKWLGNISLLTLGAIAVLIAILPEAPTTCPLKLDDNLSCGEEILIPGSAPKEKEEGVKAFADGDYLQAVKLLETARKKYFNDPEILIYLNNARLAASNTDAYTIAIVAPMTGESQALNYSLEKLRGVAQAQNAINLSDNLIGGKGLTVIIVDDGNSPEQAVKIANNLVLTGQVLAVIGHTFSEITMEVAPIYEKNKLVLISPTASTSKLSNRNDFFFRMIPSDATMAQAMASYLINKSTDQQQIVALFDNPNDIYSESLKNKFMVSLSAGGGKIVKDMNDSFDLSRTSFNASAAINRVEKQKATAIVLLPDISTLAKAIEVIKANWQLNLPIITGENLYSNYTLKFGAQEAEKNVVVATPWHSLNSPDPDFPLQAKNIWGGTVSWRTAFAYDAARALITALRTLPERKELNRIALQQILASENFSSEGATGEITFLPSGDRLESRIIFTKVVKSSCSPLGYTFLPLDYPVSKFSILECD
ncbi:MAG: ABC transporter substrate-binding protein [Okeania sp. SIO2G4]|uniref:bifunctional serine/threonine-protein kinase/ABC transporter substrate-binding protein n=1 Tax=unclassified Okeania TaxID=2634635 RepID=UPI0013BD6C6B|nr:MULTISPECIES: ABC transporter substrate-binding protein [unclassified Okeania]NEP38546.1 ABC transporter substrate-binding protein [Okeania sp. SIO2H7]NEP75940.1 ABC transporter substrate-binding protein [Okeania sp. SIO2G5]NEP97117.1 ABC transporter substrate-binding protein [Okeania sp. SIO2F5]NEQ94803.1 ABC transporter substrate-binding protein [Okeania sp. SIO2G4]